MTNSKNSTTSKADGEKIAETETVYVHSRSAFYLTNFILIVLTILLGILIKQNHLLSIESKNHCNNEPIEHQANSEFNAAALNVNMELLFKEMGDKLKKDIIEYLEAHPRSLLKEPVAAIGNEPLKEESSQIKFTQSTKVDVGTLTNNQIKSKNSEQLEEIALKIKKEKVRQANIEVKELKNEAKKPDTPNELNNFKAKIIPHIQPKKMWIPIPNR